jgi:hypothetical protein
MTIAPNSFLIADLDLKFLTDFTYRSAYLIFYVVFLEDEACQLW